MALYQTSIATLSNLYRHPMKSVYLRLKIHRPAPQNYFQAFEIYFQATKIYFQAFEIYFRTSEKVLFRRTKKLSPRGKETVSAGQQISQTDFLHAFALQIA